MWRRIQSGSLSTGHILADKLPLAVEADIGAGRRQRTGDSC